MGLAPAGPWLGCVADLVLVPAATTRETIAVGPVGRIVLRAGHVVS